MKDQVVYISGGAKVAVAGILIFLFTSSLGLTTYLLLKHPTGLENIISSSISLAQTCATAAGFIVVLFFSRFSMNLNDLRERSDRFLLEDLPSSFEIIDYRLAPYSQKPMLRVADQRNTKQSMSFVRGTNLAVYRICAHGVEQQLSVMLNVRRIVVSFMFPADFDIDDPLLHSIFGISVAGAEHSGYKMEWRRVPADDIGDTRVELRALVNLDEEFLINPSDKLFRCNDIAIMTRSVIKCRLQYRVGEKSKAVSELVAAL